jgi:NADH dehydrogenase (ubiquinone) 1 alpha subcomplex subunit 6
MNWHSFYGLPLHTGIPILEFVKGIDEAMVNKCFLQVQVVDMLVFKGQEELQYCIDHSKQRHHLLGQYIIGKEGLAGDVHKLGETDHGESEFLKSFYRGNS